MGRILNREFQGVSALFPLASLPGVGDDDLPGGVVIVLKRHQDAVEVDDHIENEELQQRQGDHADIEQPAALFYGHFLFRFRRFCGSGGRV